MQVPKQQNKFGAVSSNTATTMVASMEETASNDCQVSSRLHCQSITQLNTNLYQNPNNVNYRLKTDPDTLCKPRALSTERTEESYSL